MGIEKLTSKFQGKTFLEMEFPYLDSYSGLNQAILDVAQKGGKTIDFDFIDNDLTTMGEKTWNEVRKDFRRIYPSYGSGVNALFNCFEYPRYLAARGFNIEVRQSLKQHGYMSKSYHITWD